MDRVVFVALAISVIGSTMIGARREPESVPSTKSSHEAAHSFEETLSAGFEGIDERLVDIFDPNWIIRTKEVDRRTGVVTLSVFKLDGTRRVLKAKNNWRGCCVVDGEWRDWFRMVKRVDPRSGKIRETTFLVDGIEKAWESRPGARVVKETVRYPDGTTKIWEKEVNTAGEPAKTYGQNEGDAKTMEAKSSSAKGSLANVTIFYPNGSLKIVRVEPSSGFKNVTTIHADGARELREVDPTSGALIVTKFRPDGSFMSRRIYEEIEAHVVDILDPLWTRQIKRVDPKTGASTVTVEKSDGTKSVRKLNEDACKRRDRGDCDWTEKIRVKDARSGIEKETTIFRNGTRLVQKHDPNTGDPIFVTYSENGRPANVAVLSLSVDLRRCDVGSSPNDQGKCRENVDLARDGSEESASVILEDEIR